MASCVKCSKRLAQGTRGDKCWNCRKVPPKPCMDCGGPKSHNKRVLRCRPCALKFVNTDPTIKARRKAGIRRALADPAVKAKISRAIKEWSNLPETREMRRRYGKELYHLTVGSPQARAAASTPETRAKIGKAVAQTKLRKRGVPAGYRDEYMRLVHNVRGMTADRAAEIVRDKAKADKIAKLAAVHAESAAQHLRRITAVYRREDGWHYGTTVLTAEELVQRALNKGWEPERWAA